MGKNELGELGYRIVNHMCVLEDYVSSELVANLAKLVCANPCWRLPLEFGFQMEESLPLIMLIVMSGYTVIT